MREILFRGKRKDNEEWVKGHLGIEVGNQLVIEYCDFDDILDEYCVKERFIIPETVGQYTGLCDKNGTRIFEGDIVRGRSEYFGHDNFCRGGVFWSEGRFVISFGDSVEACEKLDDTEELREWHEDVEVIGNIFDEPELLENGGKLKA